VPDCTLPSARPRLPDFWWKSFCVQAHETRAGSSCCGELNAANGCFGVCGVPEAVLNENDAGALAPVMGKISYFIGGDATESDPQAILSGDLNIGTSTGANAPASFSFSTASGTPQTPKQPLAAFNSPTAAGAGSGSWAWTQNDFHQKSGNLGLADGSVQSGTVSGLHTYLQNSTNAAAQASFNFPM